MCAGEECLSDGYQAPAVLIPSLPGLSTQSLLRVCLLGFDLGFDFLLLTSSVSQKIHQDLATWMTRLSLPELAGFHSVYTETSQKLPGH